MKPITIIIITILAALYITSATAARFAVTTYECEQINPDRDGIRCKVDYIDGMGDTLLIRVLTRESDPQDRRQRTQYIIGRTIHNFLASGGTWIMMRATRPDGTVVERTCSRVRGRNTEHCGEWRRAGK